MANQQFLSALQEQDKVTFIKSLFTVALAAKVDVVTGKGLSQEDFTTILKDKLATIEGSHFKGVHADIAALETAHPATNAEAGSYAYVKAAVGAVEKFVMLDGGAWIEHTVGSSGSVMTAAQIKSLYEGNAETNAFTDAMVTALAGLQQGLTHMDGDPASPDENLKTDHIALALPARLETQQTLPTIIAEAMASKEFMTVGSVFKQFHAFSQNTMTEKGDITNINDIVETGIYTGNDVVNSPIQGHIMIMAHKDLHSNFGYMLMGDDMLLHTGGKPSTASDPTWKEVVTNDTKDVVKTVGVGKDFEKLHDALVFAETKQGHSVTLTLDDGTYTIGDGGVRAGEWASHGTLYIYRNMSLAITGKNRTKDGVKIILHADSRTNDAYFITSGFAASIELANMTLATSIGDISKTDQRWLFNIYSNSNDFKIANAKLQGWMHTFSDYGTPAVLDNVEFVSNVNAISATKGSRIILKTVTFIDNTKDTNIPLNEIQYDGSFISDGKAPLHHKGGVPVPPTADGDYVLKVVAGVMTWVVATSADAPIIYDAYMLGSSVNADVTLSPFHKFDGVTEEDRNAGIDFMDGQDYVIHPMYQNGLTDAHMLDAVGMFLAKDFHNAHPEALIVKSGGSAGNPFNGAMMKAAIHAGEDLIVNYDKVDHKLYVEVMVVV